MIGSLNQYTGTQGYDFIPTSPTNPPDSPKLGEDQSTTQIIDWSNARLEILDQLKDMWPRRINNFASGETKDGKIFCLTEGNQLIGAVALEPYTATEPLSLVREIGSQPVYRLTIQIVHNYLGKGYGRMLFNNACNSVIEEGSIIYIAEGVNKEINEKLYRG